jgi:FkbM family methyltransferase
MAAGKSVARGIQQVGKTLLRMPFRAVGLDVVRAALREIPTGSAADMVEAGMADALRQQYMPNHWLVRAGIATVLDIGAHIGEFATRISAILPEANIVCFEPLSQPYARLVARFASKERFHAYQFALGDESGRAVMNHNEYAPSSSLLPMADLHKQSFSFAVASSPETVEMRRLSDVADEIELKEPLLIKLDVQGFEKKVILGGEDVFARAKVVIVEVSFQTLYHGGPLFDDIYRLLRDRDLDYRGNFEQLLSPGDRQVLQADAIFCRGNIYA